MPKPCRMPYLVLCASLAFNLTGAMAASAQQPAAKAPRPPAATDVRLTIRFGDGKDLTFDPVPHKAGMTVLDAMKAAESADGKPLRFDYKGKGETAFLTAIEGVANQSGDSSDYWIYRVNDKLGNRSFGVATLAPGDRVLWTFGKNPMK